MNDCETCFRVLQYNEMAQMSGLCDACRDRKNKMNNIDRSTVFVYQESKRMIELPGRRTWRTLWLLRGASRKAVCVTLMDFDGNVTYTSVTEVE